jgi:hypothetical protein
MRRSHNISAMLARQVAGPGCRWPACSILSSAPSLAALFQWHVLHLGTLDGLDGGTRSATLSAAPEALQRLQPLIADGILGDNTVRKPEPTFALFAWVDEGGIVMDEYHKAQAVKLAIIDAAYEACFRSYR